VKTLQDLDQIGADREALSEHVADLQHQVRKFRLLDEDMTAVLAAVSETLELLGRSRRVVMNIGEAAQVQQRALKYGEFERPSLSQRAEALMGLLTAIVDYSRDAIISTTLDGIITSWNRAAEKTFGYSAAEVMAKSIRIIIPSERQAEEDYILDRIRRGEIVDHFETVRQTKDGRRLDISLTVSPICDAQGLVIGASKISRDITARKQLEREREVTLPAQREV
jgi:PAS domain S-box-containing protein